MADDARMELLFKIRAQTDEALREIRALTGETEAMGSKTAAATGKANDGFGGLTERLKGMATPLAAVGAATAAVAAAMEAARQAAAAMNREMERTGNASRDYQTAFGVVQSNMKGASPRDVLSVDAAIRSMAGNFALGAQGPVMLADAFASAKSSVPTLGNQALMSIVAEVAQELQVNRLADPGALAMGIGKIVEGSGGRLTAAQAQNLLGVMQGEGLVKDPTGVANMQAQIAAAAGTAGVDMPTMMGIAALATQVTGDTTGASTANLLQVMSGKMMNNNEAITQALGVTLTGRSLPARLAELTSLRAAGAFTDEQLQQALPALGAEGGRGSDLIRFLTTGAGQAALGQKIGAMTSPGALRGDLTGMQIAAAMALPGGAERFAADRAASALAAERAGNGLLAGLAFESEALRGVLESEFMPENGIRGAMAKYQAMRRSGFSPQEAERAARRAGRVSSTPMVGGGLAEFYEAGAAGRGDMVDANYERRGVGPVTNIWGTVTIQANDTRRVQDQIMEDAGFPLSAGGGG